MKKLLIFMIFSVIAFGSEIDNKNSISVPVKVSAEINKLRALSEVSLVPDSGYSNFNMRTTWINRDTESNLVYLRSNNNLNLIDSKIRWEISSGGKRWTIDNPASYNYNLNPFKIQIGELITNGINGAGQGEPFHLYIGFNKQYDGTARTIQMQMRGKFTRETWLVYRFSFKVIIKN